MGVVHGEVLEFFKNVRTFEIRKEGGFETADGKAVVGSYQVALPDGRIQTVTYTADHYNGFVADVKYEGVPQYPKYEPKPYAPAPKKYAPAPYSA